MQNESRSNAWYEEWNMGALVIGSALSILFTGWALIQLGFKRLVLIWGAAIWSVGKATLLAGAMVGAVLLFALLVAWLSRPGRATIFVSYPHERLTLASELAAHIEAPDLRVRMIPFVDRPDDHNAVIAEVATNIREADALVVVTAAASSGSPAGHPRFYEAEILAATVERKPVVLLGREGEFRLPPTAFEGYPVLELLALEKRGFRPVASLVHYAVGTRRTVIGLLSVIFEEAFTIALTSGFVILQFALPLYVVMVGAILALTWLRGLEATIKVMAASRDVTSVLIWAVGLLLGVWLVIRRLRLQMRLRQTFRQDFAHRRMSNEALATLIGQLGVDGIVECLLPASAQAKAVES
jgi:hypothetical protein